MTYKIISAIICVNLRFDTLSILYLKVLTYLLFSCFGKMYVMYLLFKKGDIWKTNCTRMGNCKGYRTIFTIYGLYLFFLFFFYHLIVIYYACGTFPNSHFAQHLCSCQHILVLLFANGE